MPKSKSPIILLGAMAEEIQMYIEQAKNLSTEGSGHFCFKRGRLQDQDVIIAQSGMGKVMSAMTCQRLIDGYSPRCLIFTGLAGALNASLQIGDIVVSTDLIQHDFDVTPLGFTRGEVPLTGFKIIPADSDLIALAQNSRPPGLTVVPGRILTGDQFVTHEAQRNSPYLVEELRGDAIEMEGAAVAMVCSANRIPFVVLRTISDKADGTANVDFNSFLPQASKRSFALVSHMLTKL